MYLCKYPLELKERAVAVGETLPDETVDALPIVNRIALINRGWLVKLDDKGKEPGSVFKNNFVADWGAAAHAAHAKERDSQFQDSNGRMTGDVDESILARQRREDIALDPDGLASCMPGGIVPKLPDFEDMESLPPSQRKRIKEGGQVEDPLNIDAQVVDDIEVKPEHAG